MFEDEDREASVAVFVALTVAILAAGFTTTVAITSVLALAPGTPPDVPTATRATTSVILVFEPDTAELPAEALTRIAPLLRTARANSSASFAIAAGGDGGTAAQRADAVATLLTHAGVPRERIAILAPDSGAPVNEVAIALR